MSSWIFQANPKKFDLIRDWEPGVVRSWSANQHRDEINPGDLVFFRISGKGAGIYAVGTIESNSYESSDVFGDWKVDVRYDYLIDPPILRDETNEIGGLRHFRPLVGLQGTNFRVPGEVSGMLLELIASDKRTVVAAKGRPPAWVRDELILALELYLRRGMADDRHPEVIQLSSVLNSLPIHQGWRGVRGFRNPNGVSKKLANFAALDPAYSGKGLTRGSVADREIWAEFHSDYPSLKSIADSIIDVANGAADLDFGEDDDYEAPEGRLLTKVHKSRERDRGLVKKRKEQRRRECEGALTCEVCGFDFSARYGERGEDFAECHHKIPLAESGLTKTKLGDLAIVCANCHRMIHSPRPMLSIEELKELLI